MLPFKYKRSFGLSCLVTTVIEEVILVALLWLPPRFGINIPLWISATLVLGWAGWSYLTYRMGKSTIGKTPAIGPEAMVGTFCRTTTPLCPDGYVQAVQAGSEIWQARSIAGDIAMGTEVVISDVKGLTLFVRPGPTASQ